MALTPDYTGKRQIATWVDASLLRRIDTYRKSWHLSRSAAIAVLIEHGLQNSGQTAPLFDTETGDIA